MTNNDNIKKIESGMLVKLEGTSGWGNIALVIETYSYSDIGMSGAIIITQLGWKAYLGYDFMSVIQ